MSTKVGAKTKGFIKNNDSGAKMSFQYNPSGLDYSRGASYSDISAPGMAYPNTQFTKGNARNFSVPLFFYDNPSTGVIKKYIDFFDGFLPPETNTSGYTKPPTMTFCLGYFIRKCVLEDLGVSIEQFDEHGEPIQAKITLQLRQVGV
jgi:hypothetical protein